MNNHFKLSLLLCIPFIAVFACESSTNQRRLGETRCDCPLDQITEGEYYDSTSTTFKESNSKSIGGNISGSKAWKNYIDLEIKSALASDKSSIQDRKIIRRINDKFPEIGNFKVIKKEFYCAYIRAICLDTTITDNEVFREKREKLLKLDTLFEKLYLEKIQEKKSTGSPQETLNNNLLKKSKTFNLIGFGRRNESVRLLKKELEKKYTYTTINSDFQIELELVIDLGKRQFSDNQFFHKDSSIKIKINDNECITNVDDILSIEAPNINGTRAMISEEIERIAEKIVLNNCRVISNQISKCLK